MRIASRRLALPGSHPPTPALVLGFVTLLLLPRASFSIVCFLATAIDSSAASSPLPAIFEFSCVYQWNASRPLVAESARVLDIYNSDATHTFLPSLVGSTKAVCYTLLPPSRSLSSPVPIPGDCFVIQPQYSPWIAQRNWTGSLCQDTEYAARQALSISGFSACYQCVRFPQNTSVYSAQQSGCLDLGTLLPNLEQKATGLADPDFVPCLASETVSYGGSLYWFRAQGVAGSIATRNSSLVQVFDINSKSANALTQLWNNTDSAYASTALLTAKSPDERYIALASYLATSNTRLFTIDFELFPSLQASAGKSFFLPKAEIKALAFAPDGRILCFALANVTANTVEISCLPSDLSGSRFSPAYWTSPVTSLGQTKVVVDVFGSLYVACLTVVDSTGTVFFCGTFSFVNGTANSTKKTTQRTDNAGTFDCTLSGKDFVIMVSSSNGIALRIIDTQLDVQSYSTQVSSYPATSGGPKVVKMPGGSQICTGFAQSTSSGNGVVSCFNLSYPQNISYLYFLPYQTVGYLSFDLIVVDDSVFLAPTPTDARVPTPSPTPDIQSPSISIRCPFLNTSSIQGLVCQNGSWFAPGLLNLTSTTTIDVPLQAVNISVALATISLTSVLNISGNLVLSSSASVVLGPQSQTIVNGELRIDSSSSVVVSDKSSPIQVGGCANLSGIVKLDLSNKSAGSSGSTKILGFVCSRGQFSNIEAINVPQCAAATTSLKYSSAEVSAVFSLTSTCDGPTSPIPGLTYPQFLGVVIGVPLAALVLVVSLVLVLVKPLRDKIFPHRNRTNYQVKTGGS